MGYFCVFEEKLDLNYCTLFPASQSGVLNSSSGFSLSIRSSWIRVSGLWMSSCWVALLQCLAVRDANKRKEPLELWWKQSGGLCDCSWFGTYSDHWDSTALRIKDTCYFFPPGSKPKVKCRFSSWFFRWLSWIWSRSELFWWLQSSETGLSLDLQCVWACMNVCVCAHGSMCVYESVCVCVTPAHFLGGLFFVSFGSMGCI